MEDLFDDSYGIYFGKKKKQLPYCFTYVAWILCVLAIVGCSLVIVLYGMQFGNNTSLEWLGTVTLTAVEDFFVFQPAQVFLIALFFAITSNMLRTHPKRGNSLQNTVKQMLISQTPLVHGEPIQPIENQQGNGNLETGDKNETPLQYHNFKNLVDPLALEKAKDQFAKHQAMTCALKQILFYTLFAGALCVKVFSSRSGWGFAQSKGIQELLRLRVRPKFNHTAHSGTVFQKVTFSYFTSIGHTVSIKMMCPASESLQLQRFFLI